MAFVIVAQPSGGSSTATANDDGYYKVENAPVGDVRIAVNTDATKGMMTGRAMAGTDPKAKGKRQSRRGSWRCRRSITVRTRPS